MGLGVRFVPVAKTRVGQAVFKCSGSGGDIRFFRRLWEPLMRVAFAVEGSAYWLYTALTLNPKPQTPNPKP